jgi:hypothetical protein
VIYEAFVEGKLEAPKHLARAVHGIRFLNLRRRRNWESSWKPASPGRCNLEGQPPKPKCIWARNYARGEISGRGAFGRIARVPGLLVTCELAKHGLVLTVEQTGTILEPHRFRLSFRSSREFTQRMGVLQRNVVPVSFVGAEVHAAISRRFWMLLYFCLSRGS